jgi:FlaA1/EpsC-like NDP-sugar epimerase
MYIQRWTIWMNGMVICTMPPCYMFVVHLCSKCTRIFTLIPSRAECHRNWFLQWLFSNYSSFVAYILNSFLDMFSQLRKATISSVVSVSLSVCMEQLSSNSTDFHEIWYLSMLWIYVERALVSLQSGKSNGHFTWRPVYIFEHISLNSS